MKRKNHKESKLKEGKIEEQVQALSTSESESTHQDEILFFIHSFMSELPSGLTLEPINLTTPEDANRALAMLNQTLAVLDQKQKNIDALKRLIEQRSLANIEPSDVPN